MTMADWMTPRMGGMALEHDSKTILSCSISPTSHS